MSAKTRVMVGMSGGVDSSVAAALLLREGHEVIGITLKMWPQDCAAVAEGKCCGPQAMADARSVAHRLGIPHYAVDETRAFEDDVIAYFTAEYRAGRTPNPCVMCNEKLKFGALLVKGAGLGATHVATGHYARVERDGDGYRLRRARDHHKDQSYFLFSLSQAQLARAIMPLGELSKTEVRAMAREIGLCVHDKKESQDICFVPDNNYAVFLKTRLGALEPRAGEIVHQDGRRMGRHAGIEFFTIGQRKGIHVSSPKPLYVLDIDAGSRRITVGDDDDLWRADLRVERVIWGRDGPPDGGTEAMVKIRHNHEGAAASIHPEEDGRVRIRFHQPQRAITPGQAAVFYDGDIVLGGGWIMRTCKPRSIKPREERIAT